MGLAFAGSSREVGRDFAYGISGLTNDLAEHRRDREAFANRFSEDEVPVRIFGSLITQPAFIYAQHCENQLESHIDNTVERDVRTIEIDFGIERSALLRFRQRRFNIQTGEKVRKFGVHFGFGFRLVAVDGGH